MGDTDTATAPSAEVTAPEETAPDPITTLGAKVDETLRQLEETKAAARMSQGQARATETRLEKRLAELQATLADVATRGMTAEEARVWKADQVLRDQQERVTGQSAYEQQVRDFQVEAQATLSTWGIDSNDPRFLDTYQRLANQDPSPLGWRVALNRAIQAVQQDERQKVQQERAQVEEEKVTLQRNAERAAQGPIDRGAPAGGGGKRPAEMTNEEFSAHLARLNAEARLRGRR